MEKRHKKLKQRHHSLRPSFQILNPRHKNQANPPPAHHLITMGICFSSKKKHTTINATTEIAPSKPPSNEDLSPLKELFLFKSEAKEEKKTQFLEQPPPLLTASNSTIQNEVDSILLQCGRLSRSTSENTKKYSGSKRCYEFDRENIHEIGSATAGSTPVRPRRERDTRRSRSASIGRRNMIRERGIEKPCLQRSYSGKERAPISRRVSRSPVRKNESFGRKHVCVPSSEKNRTSNNGGGEVKSSVKKKVQCVSHSHLKSKAVVDASPVIISLKKKENCRRTPLCEVDNNGRKNGLDSSTLEKKKEEDNKGGKKIVSRRGRSRDMDYKGDDSQENAAATSTSSYNDLLLEDIQNFHQSSSVVPECKGDDPFMESVVEGSEDDLVKPSMHKYVTVRRGGGNEGGGESSGSNSIVAAAHSSSSSSNSNSTSSSTCSSLLEVKSVDSKNGGRRWRRNGGGRENSRRLGRRWIAAAADQEVKK